MTYRSIKTKDDTFVLNQIPNLKAIFENYDATPYA